MTNVTMEDLGPGISGVGIGVAEAFFHVLGAGDHSDLLEERGVVGDPIALLSPEMKMDFDAISFCKC